MCRKKDVHKLFPKTSEDESSHAMAKMEFDLLKLGPTHFATSLRPHRHRIHVRCQCRCNVGHRSDRSRGGHRIQCFFDGDGHGSIVPTKVYWL